MESCRQIVEDTSSIFHSFSFLIQHLFCLIDSSIHCQTFTIKDLTIPQRRDFYVELSEIGINYTKNRYLDDNRNVCTDIVIYTSDLWSIPDFRITPDISIYQYSINIFDSFYMSLENSIIIPNNGNITVSLQDYLKFKKIFADSINSYNQQTFFNNNNNNENYNVDTDNVNQHCCSSSVSSNYKIKHELADFIFDIKDDITDAMYKQILEKIAQINC